jgi:hypothetical protein
MIDVYESAVEGTGRFGAVFERDDDTAYFYLLDMRKEEAGQIIVALSVDAINEMAADVPISIKWNGSASAAGLFVSGNLLALFDLREPEPSGRCATAEDRSLFRSH